MAKAANFTEQLDLLRQSYHAALPDKLSEIEKTWQGLQTAWDAEALQDLHRLVHNLSGSGAAYGFTRVSEAARPLDIFLQSMGATPDGTTSIQQEKFGVLFATLQQAASEPDSLMAQSDGLMAQSDGAALKVDGVGTQALTFSAPNEQANNGLIFVISDDAGLARELELQVSYFSYQVRVFTQLPALESAAAETPPSAILVDMINAGGQPVDMARVAQLKQEALAVVPLVFISSQEDISTRLQAVRAGGDAFFTKPLDTGQLIDKLDSLTATQTPEPYHILIVEDDSTLARFYTLNLQAAGMIASAITDPLQVLHALSEFRPDLILMDVYMPACSGLELATVIRQQEDFVSIPIVFLSAETDLSKQMAAMSRGGDDFLTKPIKPAHLVASVASRAHRSRVLRSLMVRDSLTGLFNHTATKEQLDIALARSRRNEAQMTFAMIDIDKFKSVNDTYGHAVGDRVIKSLSRLLQQRLRKTDIVGRYGGEEFAAVLVDTDGPAALSVLEEVRAHFAQIRHQSEAEPFSVTFSCGVATSPPCLDANELADAADKALYEAKRAGRNRIVTSEPILEVT